MLVVDGHVAWVGQDAAGRASAPQGAHLVDLDGALVTPAFVDAHVHTTGTGLSLIGLDVRPARSAAELLEAVRREAREGTGPRATGPLLGSGWDETAWADPALPGADDLDAAAQGRPVLLTRVDAHASLASSAALRELAAAYPHRGPWDTAHLTGSAHAAAARWAHDALPPAHRALAQREALRHAASLGIGSVHEMAGPAFSSLEDLTALLELSAQETSLPDVLGYWGELGGAEAAEGVGAIGAAGDILVDGTIGSRTAALREAYADGSRPAAYLTAAQVRDHVVGCTRHGLQAGFHVIGDGALDVALAGLEEAAQALGDAALRGARHRLEHVELADAEAIGRLARLGVTASVQPAFDALWGGADGMYARRLGAGRAQALNPFAAMAAAGVVLALGSDAPVTPLAPWEAVRAASHHSAPGSGLSARAAFTAHTRGGWRAARRDDAGVLAPGAPATYAVWEAGELLVQAPDLRVANWSTDPRSGVPGLPDLTPGVPAPRCLQTVVRGRAVYVAA
ncbi:amidohydrolase [Motilibacter aurantiacus]|uniref:amidohydrolase n=1 Tax=Motilibacter aurantiacus TaxID=2714955 RepID=UPI0014073092|nr:amidohydrolase family protein [Motilibacter aurantiacus]NHC47321.1 amidohydrolase family protein [Motilibacter aurantiacus]